MSINDSIASEQLQAYFERIERMTEERKAIADDIAAIYAEAKGMGFDVKVMKIVLKKREMDHNERMEQEALVELYMAALGMCAVPDHDFDFGTPVATRAPAQAKPKVTTSNTSVPEGFDPETGEEITTNTGMVPAATTEKQTPATVVAPNPAPTEPPNVAAVAQAVPSAAQAEGAIPPASSAPIQPETANETHRSSSINDEPSPEVGPQAEASPAGTGTGTPAGHEERLEGEAGSPVLPTNSLGSAAGKSGEGAEPSPAPRLTHNPETHFLNSKGLVRLHGCQRPETCASKAPRNQLCFECSTRHDGPTYQPTEEQRESVH